MTARSRSPHMAACNWLIRAFAPGCPTALRTWSVKVEGKAERLKIAYDLADDQARRIAADLVKRAGTLELVRIGRRVIRSPQAAIADDVLTIDVLLVKP